MVSGVCALDLAVGIPDDGVCLRAIADDLACRWEDVPEKVKVAFVRAGGLREEPHPVRVLHACVTL